MRSKRCVALQPAPSPCANNPGSDGMSATLRRSAPTRATWLVLALPAALLGGAYVAQYGFGLYPCEMCWWQRYPHFAALGLAAAGFFVPPYRLWTALAALAILDRKSTRLNSSH